MVCSVDSQLPTNPGPYYWRKSDGDKWARVFDVQLSNSMGLCVDLGFYYETVKERGGQWAKAHSPDELATLRAKAEAYDKGVERMAVYNGKGDFMWTDNYLEKPQKADLPVGCHYRKVRVCEVTAAGEKPALATK